MLFFLRHGESVANVNGLFAGQRDDAPLSKLGAEQARSAAAELVGLGIERIISSRLIRTQQTANEVAKVIGFDLERIENDDRIIEYDMGALTSTPIRKVTSQELVSVDGAEDPVEFKNRILDFLLEHKNSTETILVVSHAGVGRAIEAARQHLNPTEFYNIPAYPNAHAFELKLDWLEAQLLI